LEAAKSIREIQHGVFQLPGSGVVVVMGGGSCVELFVKGRKTRRNGERRINPMPLSLAFPSAAVSARERERDHLLFYFNGLRFETINTQRE